MKQMAFVSLQRRGSVGLVTLNRPDRLNAISRDLTRELHAVLTEANADPTIAGVIPKALQTRIHSNLTAELLLKKWGVRYWRPTLAQSRR